MPKYTECDSLLKKVKSLQNKLFAVPLVLDAIEYAPAADVVSREVFEQFKWERDTALQTLKEHGIGLGEIVENGCRNFEEENENLKAEIERLKEECSCLGCENEWLKAHLEQAKSEAVKEFAKELKEKYSMEIDGYYGEVVFHCDIDDLLKEMVGDDK